MEVAVRIKNEYLDLPPGTSIELEESNPFLQLSDSFVGEYSFPFSVPTSEKNMRLLAYSGNWNVRKNSEGIEAILYVNGIQHSRGTLKIETGSGNIYQPSRGVVNLYYLYGLSDFSKRIEKKYLTDCDFGADISFPWRTNAAYTGDGFWAHVTAVMHAPVGQYNYAFFPVIDEAGYQLYSNGTPSILNNFGVFPDATTAPYIAPSLYGIDLTWTNILWGYKNELVPFPYLHWVLQKVFANFGWKVEGVVLDDVDFQKIVILHHNSYIDWNNPANASYNSTAKNVVWNMKNFVPRIKIGTFLVALCNRFAWWYDWDFKNKVVKIRERRNVLGERTRRDATADVGSNYNFVFNKEGKVYSLKQSGGEEKVTIDPVNYQGTLSNRYSLPAATAERENHVWFCKGENAYFHCTREVDDTIVWAKLGDNIFDFVVKDSTEDITTGCILPGSEIDEVRKLDRFLLPGGRMFVAPLVNTPGGETETFYICYNFGLVESISPDIQSQIKYPMGGTGCYDLQGNLKTQKSLSFEYPESTIIERGIYSHNWEYFLKLLLAREEITIPILTKITDLLNLDYTDTLVINGVEFFIKNPHYSLPLKDYANMELVRL